MITVLSGGTGGAKFIQGLAAVVAPEKLTIIVNTGDDLTWWGLHVSPDVDSILYALGGILSRERGWGVQGDTFHCLERMKSMGYPSWFQLGDRDLATHRARTRSLLDGKTLTQVTADLARALGVKARVLPMSDYTVETRVATPQGVLAFQEFFVRERWQPEVLGVRYAGAEQAPASCAAMRAIAQAEAVLIAPSNPVTSIGPMLALPAIRLALRKTSAPVVAVSPIVGGAAVSGPAGALMKAQGLPVSCCGVAHAYEGLLDALVLDHSDAHEAASLRRLNVEPVLASTMMTSDAAKIELALCALESARSLARRRAAGPRQGELQFHDSRSD